MASEQDEDEVVFLKHSFRVAHSKGNISTRVVITASSLPYIVDEPLKSSMDLASMSAECFQNSIVRSRWSQLPPELLQDIAILLPDISDLTRFRAVCTRWRSSVFAPGAPKPSCLPCLLVLSYGQSTSTLSLISCSFSDSFADLRQVRAVSGRICGTGHGWLVVVSDLNLTAFEFSILLLNPLTGHRINLPSSESLIISKRLSDTRHAYDSLIAAIALLDGSNSPASGCIVMISWHRQPSISFWQYTGEYQEGKWTTVELFSPHDCIISFAYHQGMIVALHVIGRVLLVDTTSLSRTLVDTFPAYMTLLSCTATARIVEASGEVFLAVYLWNKAVAFVFRLDLTVHPPRWCPTTDIGNHVFFIDFSHLHCVTMLDHMKLNLRKNSIYAFIARGRNGIFSYSIRIFPLDKGIVEEIPLQVESWTHEPRWLLPTLI